jgi:hypothetical protein
MQIRKLVLAVALCELPFAVLSHGQAKNPQPESQAPQPGAMIRPGAMPLTAEQLEDQRYLLFFVRLQSYNDLADSAKKKGDATWAEGWSTMFQRESGLSHVQAEAVKAIAKDCLTESDKNQTAFARELDAWHVQHPGERRYKAHTPELDALREEHWNLIRRHIIQLTDKLGTRDFARLDGYILHMDDNALSRHRRPSGSNVSPIGGDK